MEILGIGFSELAFVVIIALIVLGPRDMQKAGRTIGKWLRDIVTSEGWRVFQKTSGELRNLPARMMREANEDLEKFKKEINAGMELDLGKQPKRPLRSIATDSDPASDSGPNQPPSEEPENTILPPAADSSTDEDTDSDSQKHD
jgi:sec-independent protein translocase protein TatB